MRKIEIATNAIDTLISSLSDVRCDLLDLQVKEWPRASCLCTIKKFLF